MCGAKLARERYASRVTIFDAIGLLGVLHLLAGYLLLQAQKISASAWTYSLIILLGSAAILGSLYADWNLAAASIEIAWVCISVGGLVRSVRNGRAAQPQNDHRSNINTSKATATFATA